MTATRTRVLVTNDDGVEAEGLRQLALTARSAGLEVVVAAPDENVSGASASLTAVRADGRVVVEVHRLPGLEDVQAFAVGATPAYITLLALRGGFGPAPEIVLSGINDGQNAGQAILHSGTVGAAFTAAAYGRRGLAVSLQPGTPMRWATASRLAQRLLPPLVAAPPRTVVNLNVPAVEERALKGLRRASLSSFGAVQTNIAESGQGYLAVEVAEIEDRHEPGTDAALLADGWATLTCLRPLCEVDGSGFEELLSFAPRGEADPRRAGG